MSGISKNSTYKLYYFNLKALAEPIRFILAYSGKTYEDIRIPREEWPTVKPTMPMGQMPVLEIDGNRYPQSVAIARFLAKEAGLTGINDLENLIIDSTVDTINELRSKISLVHFEPDENLKKQKIDTMVNETIPFCLSKLDEMAKENDGYLVLSKLTWADLFFAGVLHLFTVWSAEGALDKYPNLQKVANTVYSIDSIKTWIENRPDTEL